MDRTMVLERKQRGVNLLVFILAACLEEARIENRTNWFGSLS